MLPNEDTPYPVQPDMDGMNENMPGNSIDPPAGSFGPAPDVEKDAMYTVPLAIKDQDAGVHNSHAVHEPVQRSSRKDGSMGRGLIYLIIVLGLLVVIGGSIIAIFGGFDTLPKDSNKVAVIYVQGVMITGNLPGGLGYATSEEISKSIQDAADDSNVKAIVLRINSPGGSPAAAQEIVTEIKKAQEKKPVVVSMGDVAASAAYYISAPTDHIIANPDSITGSIGVIWVFEDMSGYYKEEGMEFYVAKSGEFKDMGGSWRGLSEDEKQYSEEVVLEAFQRFVDEVAQGRNMSQSDVKDLADGRVYTGSKAVELGLVDETGNLYDAIDVAAKLSGIDGEPVISYANKPSWSRILFGGESNNDVGAEEYLSYFYKSPFGKIIA
ncbi:MAG: signal peptide peptidase SppA [ANME-2 cluster archaeon]|nr:signal peptide peptidase SppA [ANME-2 cluster archaeon]MDF1532722.1 signal peptide peptidase SppA [ANME-2 cluster archaeon]